MKLILLSLLLTLSLSQDNIWITVENGLAFTKSRFDIEWIPVVKKEKLPSKSFLRSSNAVSVILNSDLVYHFSDSAYLYLNDLLIQDRNDLLIELSRLDLSTTLEIRPDSNESRKKNFGITYGSVDTKRGTSKQYFRYREKTIRELVKQKNYSAALLSLQRLMYHFPEKKYDLLYVENLFQLYQYFKFYGRINDHLNILKRNAPRSRELESQILSWDKELKKQLKIK